jgi:hypothetical protein
MLKFRLDKTLAALVSHKPFAAVVFDLIGVAEREGWTSELVEAARDHIPGNPELKRFCAQHPHLLLDPDGREDANPSA